MHHFFIKPEQKNKEYAVITGSDVNHIKNVLRMTSGEKVLLSDGTGQDFVSEIEEIQSEAIRLRILSEEAGSHELPAKLYLFQGLPKSDKMELIIQKAVELGVYEIIPLQTKRAVVRLDEKKEQNKLKRWRQIAESAAKQSKRSIIPNITQVKTLKEALAYAADFDYNVIPYECAVNMKETREYIRKCKNGRSIGIFIGPEGGFEETEVLLAKEQGAFPVTLGKRILRTETAGIAVLSVLMFELERD